MIKSRISERVGAPKVGTYLKEFFGQCLRITFFDKNDVFSSSTDINLKSLNQKAYFKVLII
jgi:hypothetical protein